jgi:hypothetical protein
LVSVGEFLELLGDDSDDVLGESGEDLAGDVPGVYVANHSIFCVSRKYACVLKLPFVSFPNAKIMVSPSVMIAECPARLALGPSDTFPLTLGVDHLNGREDVSKTANAGTAARELGPTVPPNTTTFPSVVVTAVCPTLSSGRSCPDCDVAVTNVHDCECMSNNPT